MKTPRRICRRWPRNLASRASGSALKPRGLGWKLRTQSRKQKRKVKKPDSSTRTTLQRLKELLQKRLGELESQINEIGEAASATTSERDIRAMNTLVRTLEKVLELERKDRSLRYEKSRERRNLDDAERDELARRIASLCPRPDGSGVREIIDAARSAGDSAGLALLGEAGPAAT